MNFNQYINGKQNEILSLKLMNLNNINVISLIMVETYYRKPLFRYCEYVYWIITGNDKISIGLSQMKVKYIKTLKNIKFIQRIKYIYLLESYKENYFLVEKYLKEYNVDSNTDDEAICKIYNGPNVSSHYIENFKIAKKYIIYN